MINTNQNLLFLATILALCVISFVHVFLFPLYDISAAAGLGAAVGPDGQRRQRRTFAEFEQTLCMTNLRPVSSAAVAAAAARRAGRRVVTRGGGHNSRKGQRAGGGRGGVSAGSAGNPLQCPQDGIVTVAQGGRLGNQMWEYASVWAVSRRTGLEPYVPRCIKAKLEQVFESLSVPTIDEIGACKVDLGRFVSSLDTWNYTNQSIVLRRYSTLTDVVLMWVQDVAQEFSFRSKYIIRRDEILRQAVSALIGSSSQNVTPIFVGVHVRRTDYIDYLVRKHGSTAAPASFYTAAMRFFDGKYHAKQRRTNGNDIPGATVVVLFIVVSDDPAWCEHAFQHHPRVYVSAAMTPTTSATAPSSRSLSRASRSNNRKRKRESALPHPVLTPHPAATDLAVLAGCNHSIFDYGTFGIWGAILAGGETVYYNLSTHSSARVGALLPHWHAMS